MNKTEYITETITDYVTEHSLNITLDDQESLAKLIERVLSVWDECSSYQPNTKDLPPDNSLQLRIEKLENLCYKIASYFGASVDIGKELIFSPCPEKLTATEVDRRAKSCYRDMEG